MYDYLDEPVDVAVDFSWPRVQPTLIRWNRRDYPVGRVNLVHSAREGEKKFFYFSVSDAESANVFKLRFDSETLEWRLVEIYNDG